MKRRLKKVSIGGLPSCPHCHALLQESAICSICGKSKHDEVEAVVQELAPSSWATDLDRRRILVMGLTILVVVAIGAVGWSYLNRAAALPDPVALPTPVPTSSTTTLAGESPSLSRPDELTRVGGVDGGGGDLGITETDVGAERGVGGISPWDTPPPLNVITGTLLDDADYEAGIAAVTEVLSSPPLATELGSIEQGADELPDLAAAEASQPFAARKFSTDELAGEIWIFAAALGDEPSAIYLAIAAAAWPTDGALDQFAPRPGVRVHLVSDDGSEAIWTEQRPDRMMLLFVPSGTDPATVGGFVEKW